MIGTLRRELLDQLLIVIARELGLLLVPVPAGPAQSAARVIAALPFLPPVTQWVEAASHAGHPAAKTAAGIHQLVNHTAACLSTPAPCTVKNVAFALHPVSALGPDRPYPAFGITAFFGGARLSGTLVPVVRVFGRCPRGTGRQVS
jgi:hypothetical protein